MREQDYKIRLTQIELVAVEQELHSSKSERNYISICMPKTVVFKPQQGKA
jgi:hypothetical protein